MVLYNLTLDDLIPRFHDFMALERLTKAIPGIKITVFMPANSSAWGAGRNDILKHQGWCKSVAALPDKNFEFMPHGYYHNGPGTKRPEFANLSVAEAQDRLVMTEGALTEAGLTYVKGFRPPGWELSQGTIEALGELGYLFLADDWGVNGDLPSLSMLRILSNADIRVGPAVTRMPELIGILPDFRQLYLDRAHSVSLCANNLVPNLPRLISKVRQLQDVHFVFLSELAALPRAEQERLGLWYWKFSRP